MHSRGVVCRPSKQGGLGVVLQSMNWVLLIKWVDRIMHPWDNLFITNLQDNYGRGLNWESRILPQSQDPHHFGKSETNLALHV